MKKYLSLIIFIAVFCFSISLVSATWPSSQPAPNIAWDCQNSSIVSNILVDTMNYRNLTLTSVTSGVPGMLPNRNACNFTSASKAAALSQIINNSVNVSIFCRIRAQGSVSGNMMIWSQRTNFTTLGVIEMFFSSAIATNALTSYIKDAADAWVFAEQGYNNITWHNILVNYIAVDKTSKILNNGFIDGKAVTILDSAIDTSYNGHLFTLGTSQDGGITSLPMDIEVCYVWFNRTANTTDAQDLNASFYEPTITTTQTINILNKYDNSSVIFNITATNGTSTISNSSINGALSYFNLYGNWNFNVNIQNFYQSNLNFNVTFTGTKSYINYSSQSFFNVTIYEKISGARLQNFSSILPYYSNSTTGNQTLLLTNNASQNITITKSGYWNSNIAASAQSGQISNVNASMSTAYLIINASRKTDNAAISSFSISITGLNYSYSENQSTASGIVNFSLINGDYVINFTASQYESLSANITINSALHNYTFTPYYSNSLIFDIYDEKSNILFSNIPKNATIQLLGPSGINNVTWTSHLILTNQTAGSFTITFSADGYQNRIYFLTLANMSSFSLNAYLLNNSIGVPVIITTKDESNNPIQNVTITSYKTFNLSSIPVQQTITDGTGQAQLFMDTTIYYNLIFSAEGYSTKSATIKPIADASGQYRYTFILTSTSPINFDSVYGTFSYSLFPSGDSIIPSYQNFSIFTTSATGSIEYFCIKSNYSGVLYSQNISGQAAGGSAFIMINLTNATGSSINIEYCIKSSGFDEWKTSKIYFISHTIANQTGTPAGEAPSISSQYSVAERGGFSLIIIIIATIAAAIMFSGAEAGYGSIFGAIISIILGFLNIWLGLILIVIVAFTYRLFTTERYEVR